MAGLRIKVIPVAICLLLMFLLIPCTGVYADSGYSIKITEPVSGSTTDWSVIDITIVWTRPETAPNVNVHIEVKLVTLDNNLPGEEAFVNYIIKGDSGFYYGPSDTTECSIGLVECFRKYNPDLRYAPSGHYEIVASLISGTLDGDTVATTQSTFHYINPDVNPMDKPVIEFSITPAPPATQKAGVPVTLKWKVAGADTVSIDHGVGNVAAEGNKEVTPTEATRAVEFTGDGGDTEVITYTADYTLKATNSSGNAAEKTVTIKIQPLTIDEIFKAYKDWGTSNVTYHWLDGTSDKQPLIGPAGCGGTNNLFETVTFLSGVGSYEGVRWDCNAMQYRSLTCLNELKTKGKLIGWDYMAIEGATIPRTGIYPVHQAVAIWQKGDDWQSTATVLDPHDRQEPHSYSVTDGLDWMFPWSPDGDYKDVYPSIPGGSAGGTGKYQLNEFTGNFADRWGNGSGSTTPWQGEETAPASLKKKLIDNSLENLAQMAGITVHCPVNLLITNSTGQRLGKLSNGTMVAEFEPLDAYYWSDENGDQQWYFLLNAGTYKIDITGTSNGNFRLLTYTGGEDINDYGENLVATGQQAALSIGPGTVSELTLADGTKVTPEAKAIKSFLPAPTTEPTPAPTSTTEEDKGLNLSFIGSIIGGVIVILLLLFLFGRRKK